MADMQKCSSLKCLSKMTYFSICCS